MRDDIKWMLYGATGYTGTLVAEEAVRRGHHPVLAGRNVEKLRPLARRLGLKYVAFDLSDVNVIAEHIAEMDIVYHCAGPFIHTSDPMIRACLATHTHYLDITGEIPVFENTFSYEDAAESNGIALISGVGFDVVPTDCLNLYVAEQVEAADQLEIGISGFAGASAGTIKSGLELAAEGMLLRRDGRLQRFDFGKLNRMIPLPNGVQHGTAVPWGDVATAYRTTGIPNITPYMAMPGWTATAMRFGAPIFGAVMRSSAIRNATAALIDRVASGPDQHTRETYQSYIWSHASSAAHQAQAWLITPEPYQFTVEIAIHAVEQTAELRPTGALTPALAFGADFVLKVPGVRRLDQLED